MRTAFKVVTSLTALAALTAAGVWAADLRLTGIGRVDVKTADAARSRRFYSEVLRFVEVPRDSASGRAWYKVNENQFLVIVPDRKDEADRRVAHFTLTTSDVRGASETLKQRGLTTTAVSPGDDGSLQFTLIDPDGNRIVIAQAVAGSIEDRTRGRMLGAQRISTRLRHVGIQVEDLDRAAKFYQDKLGLAPQTHQHGKTRWADVHLPGGDYIQMRIAPERRPDLEHIAFDVADAHATYKALLQRGVPPGPVFEPVVGYAGRLKINFIDPDKMLVELMELGAAKAGERREQ